MVMMVYQSRTLALSLDCVEDIEANVQQPTLDLNLSKNKLLLLAVASDLLTYELFHACVVVKF